MASNISKHVDAELGTIYEEASAGADISEHDRIALHGGGQRRQAGGMIRVELAVSIMRVLSQLTLVAA